MTLSFSEYDFFGWCMLMSEGFFGSHMLSCVFGPSGGKTVHSAMCQGLAPIQCASIRNRNSNLCYGSERLSRLSRLSACWGVRDWSKLARGWMCPLSFSSSDQGTIITSFPLIIIISENICSNISAYESSFSSIERSTVLIFSLESRLKTSDGGSQ